MTRIPLGSETGSYLAVDLGGTNFRVSMVDLDGNSKYKMAQIKCQIPKTVMVNSSYEPLFDFIAENISNFLREQEERQNKIKNPKDGHCMKHQVFKLGFTFSFTFKNQTLGSGIMLQWDKGWDIPDALGRDPAKMLQDAIDKLNLPVQVVAVISDSVGSLMARSYTSATVSTTLLAAIFGTGTNAAYFERRENVHKAPPISSNEKNSLMILNTEWGAWADSDPSILMSETEYDQILDYASSNTSKQILEKRISGLYLGELLRLITLQMFEQNLFTMVPSNSSSPLFAPYSIDSVLLSHMERDQHESLASSREAISSHLGVSNVSYNDAYALRSIGQSIVRRSARLAGAAMGAIILQSGRLHSQGSLLDEETSTRSARQQHDGQILKQKPTEKSQSLIDLITNFLNYCAPNFFASIDGSSMSKGEYSERTCSSRLPESETHKMLDIGVEGTLFESYPGFDRFVKGALRDVPGIGLNGEKRISIGASKDGPSLGAALAAHSAHQH